MKTRLYYSDKHTFLVLIAVWVPIFFRSPDGWRRIVYATFFALAIAGLARWSTRVLVYDGMVVGKNPESRKKSTVILSRVSVVEETPRLIGNLPGWTLKDELGNAVHIHPSALRDVDIRKVFELHAPDLIVSGKHNVER